MAGNHGNEPAGNGQRTSRRTFMRGVGTTTTVAAVGRGSVGGAVAAETTVDLGEKGLGDGDVIDPYLEEFFIDDTEVHVPAGEYDYTGTGLCGEKANCALVGAPDGVTFTRPDDPEIEVRPTVLATEGTVRIENVTVRGERGDAVPSEDSVWTPVERPADGDSTATGGGSETDRAVTADTRPAASPRTVRDETHAAPASLPNRLTIDGTGDAEGSVAYEFAVSGPLALDEGRTVVGSGEPLWLTGDIADGQVSGHVRTGVDAFFYGGTLQRIDIDGEATVSIFHG